MKNVLTTCALTVALIFVISLDCPPAVASGADHSASPSVAAVQLPLGGSDIVGACGGGSSDGDPDDLGGGFRSTNGQTKESVREIKPTTPLVTFMIRVQQVWMMVLR